MNLVPIGNSKGVRLSKNLIDKYGLSNGFEIIELDDGLKLLGVYLENNLDLDKK